MRAVKAVANLHHASRLECMCAHRVSPTARKQINLHAHECNECKCKCNNDYVNSKVKRYAVPMCSLTCACICTSVTRKVGASKCAPPLAQMRYLALISVPRANDQFRPKLRRQQRVAAIPFKDDTRVQQRRRCNQVLTAKGRHSHDR